jgi:PAS domain S-box-containing protein
MPKLYLRRPLLAGFAVFLFSGVAAAALIWRADVEGRQEQRARVFNVVDDHADALHRAIEHSLSATYALAAMVRQGKGTVPGFDEIAGEMLFSYPGVSELALAPGGIIRNVVPLAGNEKAVGHNLLQDPTQNKEAFLARDSGKLTLAGPLDLVQGGRGVVGRLPVFLRDATGTPRFWGFTLVVIRVPEVFEAARLIELAAQGIAYELRRILPDSGQNQIIAASASAALIDPVEKTLQVPNATWTLSAAPIGGWGDPAKLALNAALGLLFSLLLAYLAKLLLELAAHQDGLEALVVRRTAEARAREADLNRAQAIARVGSWTLDLVTNEVRGSAEGMRIIGASEGVPFNFRAFLERVHPDDRDAVNRASRAALKGEPHGIDFRMLDGDAIRWVHSQAELAVDADGRRYRALGTVQDITERRVADETLRASESRYRELFEANPHPMWVWDLRTLAFLAVNDAAVVHYGYSRDEFLAMIITDIRPPEEVPRLLQRLALVQKQDIRDAGIWRHRRKDGTLIDVEIVSHTTVFDGRPAQIVLANDVTERLQAERNLRESEARYRALTELSTDWYWEQDENLRFTLISKPSAGQESIDFDTLIGKTRREASAIAWEESRLAALEAIAEARQPFRDFEIGRSYRNGPMRYVQMSGEPIFDASGRFAGYRGIGKDITERKHAEEALRESEERFRSLTEMSSDFYWESDAEHRLTQRGSADEQSALSVFQKSAQIGERRWDNPYLSPDEAGWQAHRAVLDAHLPFRDFEFSRVGADLTEHHISISGDPVFDASGAFRGYRGVGSDITGRKRAEQALRESEHAYRTMFESAPEGVWMIGPDRRTTDVNQRMCDLLGYAREDMLGRDRIEFVDQESGKVFQANARRIPSRKTRTFEIALRHRDGHNIPTEFHVTDLINEDGSLMAVLAFVVDLTDRKRHEEELRQINEELEQRVAERTQALAAANSELEAFSYSVSRELGSPLWAIHGFSSLVEQQYAGQIDEPGRGMLRRIGADAREMGSLLNDLLRLSRISRQAMRVGQVDLSALAREVSAELEAEAPERKVEWLFAPKVPAEGDPGLLRVVLHILIGNAWKYSSKREAARIEFGVAEKDGRPVYFVRDNGAGIDMAYAGTLFGAFQGLDSVADFPGSGIGLATVSRVIHRHGGEVWAEGRMGEGATFFFSLGKSNEG